MIEVTAVAGPTTNLRNGCSAAPVSIDGPNGATRSELFLAADGTVARRGCSSAGSHPAPFRVLGYCPARRMGWTHSAGDRPPLTAPGRTRWRSAMTTSNPAPTRLEDYAPSPFLISEVGLEFDLDAEQTRVRSRLRIRRNPTATRTRNLVLDGIELNTRSVRIDGEAAADDRFEIAAETLTLRDVPDRFELETEVVIQPQTNRSLEGLYYSEPNLCTQCEAEGFRKNHVVSRPPRHACPISDPHHRRPRTVSGHALQWQPDRPGHLAGRAPLGHMGGSVSKAELPLCADRGSARMPGRRLHDEIRAECRAPDIRQGQRHRTLRTCNAIA